MKRSRQFQRAGCLAAAILLSACAALQRTDPLQVTVAGIEPMQGQGMELRMLVKLRIQNPNDAPIEYDGVALKIDVQGKTFATGVSDESGSVPRFGESVISVPVTTSAMRMVGRGWMARMRGSMSAGATAATACWSRSAQASRSASTWSACGHGHARWNWRNGSSTPPRRRGWRVCRRACATSRSSACGAPRKRY